MKKFKSKTKSKTAQPFDDEVEKLLAAGKSGNKLLDLDPNDLNDLRGVGCRLVIIALLIRWLK